MTFLDTGIMIHCTRPSPGAKGPDASSRAILRTSSTLLRTWKS
jgi:hypothetical protein